MKFGKLEFEGGAIYNKRSIRMEKEPAMVAVDTSTTCWYGRVPIMMYATIKTIGERKTKSRTG